MKWLNPDDECKELSLDDVFLVQQVSGGGSRMSNDTTPVDIPGSWHPIVAANMTAVVGRRMCEGLARYGGLAILPQDKTIKDTVRIIGKVKDASGSFDTPLYVGPDDELTEVWKYILKREGKQVVVIDRDRHVLGVIGENELAGASSASKAGAVMNDRVVVLDSELDDEEMFQKLVEARLNTAPVVDNSGCLIGSVNRHLLATRMPLKMSDGRTIRSLIQPSLDASGRLMMGAAVGMNGDLERRVRAICDAGIDVIVVDTAHGSQRSSMGEAIRRVRGVCGPDMPIVAGNVSTYKTAEFLFEAGANIVKVNVGPGAMCTTRLVTGVGRPSFSAVVDCVKAAKDSGGYVWADGGVKHPRDMALYLAAGASRVMIGTGLAACFESPADFTFVDGDPSFNIGNRYKSNHGMASQRAVVNRTQGVDPHVVYLKTLYREGISDSQVWPRVGEESVGEFVTTYVTGLQSSMSYSNATNLREFHENAEVGVQTQAGYREGTPHGAERK